MKESNKVYLTDILVKEEWSSSLRLDENTPIYEFFSKETSGFLLQNMIFKYKDDFYLTDGLLRNASQVRPFKCNAIYKINDDIIEHIKGRLKLCKLLKLYELDGDGVDALSSGFNCEKFDAKSLMYEEIARVFDETNKFEIINKAINDVTYDLDVMIDSIFHDFDKGLEVKFEKVDEILSDFIKKN
ncbi:Uncharacterised protein [Candidatus Tiddalikarchaeum anstoanum]|nr:Uncharacterised protein [Candidatus Tiddalikarchaeum anstoanum]